MLQCQVNKGVRDRDQPETGSRQHQKTEACQPEKRQHGAKGDRTPRGSLGPPALDQEQEQEHCDADCRGAEADHEDGIERFGQERQQGEGDERPQQRTGCVQRPVDAEGQAKPLGRRAE